VDVDQEGTARNDVIVSLAAREAARRPFTRGDGGDRPHGCHRRGTGQDASGSGHYGCPRLITHNEPGGTLMGKDANRNRL
jgi:hypothetical protein